MELTDDIKNLFETILKLNSIEECANFFEDLCTYKELDAMTQRVKAAKLLLNGEVYESIVKKTNISSATLARVSKCVKYGKGYKNILQ